MAGLLLLTATAGCVRREPLPVWRPGLAGELGRAAEADSTLLRSERWLLESGLAHAVPQGPDHDPALASARLERLLELHPNTAHAATIGFLLPLLREAGRRETEARGMRREIERLREEIAAREARIDTLSRTIEGAALRDDRHRATIAELQARLREREKALQALEEKLQGLMRIDLRPRP